MNTKVIKDRHRNRGNSKPVPLRKCFVTGAERPKAELVRFVVGPSDEIVPDLDERLPGRGLWLSADRDVLNTACTKRLFAKSARRKVEVPDDLAMRVEMLLAQRCMDLIGLARRSGAVIAGFEKVRAFFKEGRKGLLLAASDGARGGRGKLLGVSQIRSEMDVLSSTELGQALGRDAVVHAVVGSGPLADRIGQETERLRGIRGLTEKVEVGD